MSVNTSDAWNSLVDHAKALKDRHLKDLFTADSNRFERFSFTANNYLLDLSKQRITKETVDKLVALAHQQKLGDWIEQLFNGDIVNYSEQRPALHTALRQPLHSEGTSPALALTVDDQDIVANVHASLAKMESLVNQIHKAQWRGYDGSPIKNVVNIGVGGSDLGPLTACRALSQYAPQQARDLNVHFVSSMDGSQLASLLDSLDPTSTLFIISSKSFSTIDTLANANTAREWLINGSGIPVDRINHHHFIAATASPEKALEWGIPERNQLLFWDWAGGRYSLWSVIGLPIALHIGMDNFRAMLKGAHEMDTHFRETPFEQNLPVLLGLIGVWNINFLNIHAHAVLPYDGRLKHLPAYLEQLEMESNGKNVNRSGNKISYNTCPILWGEVGPNAQHAFYQLLHQGTESVMCDFIAPVQRYQGEGEELQNQHQLALVNCLAQSRLLALGDSVLEDADSAPAHKRYLGNQPSTTLMFDSLTPETFGALIALYEQKVFVQSVIWEINPFDQWGVELGKQVATSLLGSFATADDYTSNSSLDNSTNGLLEYIQRQQGGAKE
ncbi:MAG: glucose-6-phosphate isomerase [Amphritea sp.]